MRTARKDEPEAERFDGIYAHLEAVRAYALRRGSRDADGIAAEAMEIAWRRRQDLPAQALPWLIATARNLLHAEYRARRRSEPFDPGAFERLGAGEPPDFEVDSLDAEIDRALAELAPIDREALLLVAWDELAPAEAATALGIRPSAFRVRLHRARKRFKDSYRQAPAEPAPACAKPLEERT